MNIKPWFFCPEPDLDLYPVNYSGTCMLTWNDDDGICYIMDCDKLPLDYNLFHEVKAVIKALPPVNVVFGINQDDDSVYRAVRSVEPIGSNHYIRLIDFGDSFVFDPLKNTRLYFISKKAQQDSSKAIPCRVVEVFSKKGVKMSLKDGLEQAFYNEAVFTVKEIKDKNLVVTLRLHGEEESSSESECDDESDDEQLENPLQFTEEQLRVLYEEPATTTNALKAILGYVPHDDERLCPFYEKSTSRCFKGNSCQLDHIKPLENGLTRDKWSVFSKLVPQIIPLIGSMFKAYITWVLDINEFYLYIPKLAPISLTGIKAKLNKTEHCELYRNIKRLLYAHELVLVKCDKEFRRGRTIEVIEEEGDTTMVQVFFIDYGAVKTIPLTDVFEWNSFCDEMPALVYRCKLANVRMRKRDKNTVRQVQTILSQQGELNVIIEGIVVEDLYVSITSADGIDFAEKFCEMAITERAAKLEETIQATGYILDC